MKTLRYRLWDYLWSYWYMNCVLRRPISWPWYRNVLELTIMKLYRPEYGIR